jgi:hypothetical protein
MGSMRLVVMPSPRSLAMLVLGLVGTSVMATVTVRLLADALAFAVGNTFDAGVLP